MKMRLLLILRKRKKSKILEWYNVPLFYIMHILKMNSAILTVTKPVKKEKKRLTNTKKYGITIK